MNNIELMKVGDRSLIARVKGDGTVHEYVVGSYFNGESWDWGHYFGKSLEDALHYIKEDRHELLEHVAYWMFIEGSKKTTYGNWIFDRNEVEERFGEGFTDKDYDEISSILLSSTPYVLDIWNAKESGDKNIALDVNYSTIFTEEDEE